MLNILVVDDERSVRAGLLRMLAASGYQAVAADSGMEALQSALRTRPDVILMDLMMPMQDGLEAAREIRKHPDLANIPIIALTASPRISAESQALFHCVLTKPCRAVQLLAAIDAAARP